MSIICYSAKTKDLLDEAINWLEQGYQISMLTLVSIEGSAPYPVGTQMLVRNDGEFLGQISGGCIETALVEQAQTVISNNKNAVERYGSNSRFFDIQLPCGSGLDIEFDVQTTLEEYQSIKGQLNRRKAVRINEVKNYKPIPRLLLFGQGPIVKCLTELANNVGFEVLLFDYQQSYAFQKYCDQYTALVSLFHEHDLETDILLSVLDSELFYIGALGSQKTQLARLKKLEERGVSSQQLKKIHGPVGLNIGAVTPSQIAVSILAQVIAVMNNHAP